MVMTFDNTVFEWTGFLDLDSNITIASHWHVNIYYVNIKKKL